MHAQMVSFSQIVQESTLHGMQCPGTHYLCRCLTHGWTNLDILDTGGFSEKARGRGLEEHIPMHFRKELDCGEGCDEPSRPWREEV